MTGLWLITYIILWIIVIMGVITILAMAREIEVLHRHLDSLKHFLENSDVESHKY